MMGASMKYEYTIRIFSIQDLKEAGIVVDPRKNIVYACKPDSSCEVHDVSTEQIENLSHMLNILGKDGWELVQLIFRATGVVSFWKRCLEEGDRAT
jgi:hypothetical protein